MGHYRSNLRDLEFMLYEVLSVGEQLGRPPYADIDRETAHEILTEVERLAAGPLAAPFAEADRTPPTFDPAAHAVTLPAAFTRAYQTMIDAGYYLLGLPDELGGTPIPRPLLWSISELILGSNPAAHMYAAGPTFAAILHDLGTPAQKRMAEIMVQRRWASTMVLTEPDAGSDVGAGRTTAIRQPDGTWVIEGVKRFITSGDWDWPENIVHLVLARPEGAGPGTKGLSLFVVPKHLFDLDTGALGGRNGVKVTGLEHKMGLKVSSTCELTFGAGKPAVGYLVGDIHDGIAQMFRVIEHARMTVGTKAIATLSTGYLNALDFARIRVQCADLTQRADKAAPRVTIIHHPDVRRMLMLQKSYAEGLRALVLFTAAQQDRIFEAALEGSTDDAANSLNDLLLPLVKGVGSERSYELLSLSLQTLGGSGYLQDYPIEQYLRDAKIDTLYEGTTAIQAQDLFFRKIMRDEGVAFSDLSGRIRDFVTAEAGNGRLKSERHALADALDDVHAMVDTMAAGTRADAEPSGIYRVGLNANRLLMSLGDLVIGWLLLRQAEVAIDALDRTYDQGDTAFYRGKIASARFFAGTVLPELRSRRAVAQAVGEGASDDLMQLPEDAF